MFNQLIILALALLSGCQAQPHMSTKAVLDIGKQHIVDHDATINGDIIALLTDKELVIYSLYSIDYYRVMFRKAISSGKSVSLDRETGQRVVVGTKNKFFLFSISH